MIPWNPHNYQSKGITLLTTQEDGGAGLGIDPGMGKTTIAMAAQLVLRKAGYATKMLVVAPLKPTYDTWPHEKDKWEDFTHLSVGVLHGPRKDNTIEEDHDIYAVNPEGLVWLFKNHSSFIDSIDILCVDESTKFKNSTSKRFRLLKKHLHRFKYRWILTGTMTPNGLEDLFGQVYIMDLGATLGKYITHYRNTYFYPSGFGGYKYKPHEGAHEQIAMLVGPKLLSLDAEDYLEMPDFIKVLREVTLPKEAMELYKEVEKEFIANFNGSTILAANAAAAGTKCRQVSNGAVFVKDKEWTPVHNAKIEALEEIVEETNGLPLLVLYEFTHDRERIMEFLGKDAFCITGVTGAKLHHATAKFNTGQLKYLVAHSGSLHGLNIQGACYHMVWFGVTWNLENYIQTVWRLYRQGQLSKIVMCYILVAKGTLDERVVKVLDHKEEDQDKLKQLFKEFTDG